MRKYQALFLYNLPTHNWVGFHPEQVPEKQPVTYIYIYLSYTLNGSYIPPGGGFNPSQKYLSNWSISPSKGEHFKKWNHHLVPIYPIYPIYPVVDNPFIMVYLYSLPQINIIRTWKYQPSQKETIVFQPSIFRCENVSFREGNILISFGYIIVATQESDD